MGARATVEQEQLPARVLPFLRRIHMAYAAADLVVCRSGAMTLAEIAACGTPAILVPYPHAAHDHQVVNAMNLVERGAAAMILDRELTGERLAREVRALAAATARRCRGCRRTRARFARPDAAERIVQAASSAGRRGRKAARAACAAPRRRGALMYGRTRRIHFIGIGGSGMSGIAEVLLNMGYQVSGSDLKASEATERLVAARRPRVHRPRRRRNVEGAQVVVLLDRGRSRQSRAARGARGSGCR